MRAAPVILVLVLSACTRQMAGLVHTPDGAPLGRAEYTYEEDVFGSGTVTATMPDGEFFVIAHARTRSWNPFAACAMRCRNCGSTTWPWAATVGTGP